MPGQFDMLLSLWWFDPNSLAALERFPYLEQNKQRKSYEECRSGAREEIMVRAMNGGFVRASESMASNRRSDFRGR